jgi:hypothetical protein
MGGGDVVKRGEPGSPGSDGASPYRARDLYESVIESTRCTRHVATRKCGALVRAA